MMLAIADYQSYAGSKHFLLELYGAAVLSPGNGVSSGLCLHRTAWTSCSEVEAESESAGLALSALSAL